MKIFYFTLFALLIGCGYESSIQTVKSTKPPCFADISKCDVSGRYNLEASDTAPTAFLSSSLTITQAANNDLAVGVNFNFNTASNSYFFKGVENAVWDGDSVKVTISGKLRSFVNGFPVAGGFTTRIRLDAKQKNTVVFYAINAERTYFTALDGTITFSDSSQTVFPDLDTPVKVMFIQF